MFVRVEDCEEKDVYLVVGELDNYIGKVHGMDFAECVIEEAKSFISADDYLWWYVDGKCLKNYLK